MIYGNINNLDEFSFLPNYIQRCFEYIKSNDLKNFENGRYEIDGENIFLNIDEYTTTTVDKRIWEAHKKYLDIHLILKEEEIVDVNFVNNLKEKEFKEENDLIILEGNKKSSIILKEGDFLICYPNDAHMTALKIDKPKLVKKAVFKVKI